MEDPKYTKALYDQLSSKLELGTQADFEKQIGTDEKFRKAIFDQSSSELDLGDYKTFEGYVKKKDSPADYGLPSKEVFSEMFGNISRPLDEYDSEKFKTPDLSLKSPEFKGPELESLSGTVAAYVSGERITGREAKANEATYKVEAEKKISELDKEIASLPQDNTEMLPAMNFSGGLILPSRPVSEEKAKLLKAKDDLKMAITTPDKLTYILGKAYNQSLIGLADGIINGEKRAPDEWLRKYDAGTLTDATATALGFMLDMPFFGGMGKVGEVIGKAAAKPIVDRVMTKGVEKLTKAGIEESLAKKLTLKAAGKVSQTIAGMTSSGVALGSYSAVSDALNQWAVPDADFEDIKWGQSLKAGVKNFTLGVGVGGLGIASAAIASKASAIPNAVARIGTKVGVAAGGLTAESALFTYGGALLDGRSPNEVTGKEFMETVALLGMLKVSNVAGKIPEAVSKPKETLTNLYRSLQYDPKKPGQGQFEVDIEPWEVDAMGGKDYKSVMDIASKDDKVLADILKSDKVPALLKQKLLWGARGVAIESVNLNGDRVVPNEEFVDIYNKEGVLVGKDKYASKQEAEQASLEMGLQLEDNKMQRRSAEPDVDRVKIISDLKSKGTDVDKLLMAVDKPVKERTPEESKMVSDYYSMIPKEQKKEKSTEKVSIGERDIVTQSEKNILKIKSESSFNVPILKGKEQVGKATIEDSPDGWRIKWIEADRPDKDTRGAGRDAMILLNKEALKEGKVLISDISGKNSTDMQRAWEKLVESGEAAQLPDKTWSFNKPEKPIEPEPVKPKAKTETPIETGKVTIQKELDKDGLVASVKNYNGLTPAKQKKNTALLNNITVAAQKLGIIMTNTAKGVRLTTSEGKKVTATATKVDKEKIESQKLLEEHTPAFQQYVNDVLTLSPDLRGVLIKGLSPDQRIQAYNDIKAGRKSQASLIALNELELMHKTHGGIEMWHTDTQTKQVMSPKEIRAEIDAMNRKELESYAPEDYELAYKNKLINKDEYEKLKDYITDEQFRNAEEKRVAEEDIPADITGNDQNIRQEGSGAEEVKPITNEKPIDKSNPPISKGEENNLSGGTETGKKPVIAEGEKKPIRTTDPVKQKQIEAIDKEYDAKIVDKQKELDGIPDAKKKALLDADERNGLFGDAKAEANGELIKPEEQGFEYSQETRNAIKLKYDERAKQLTNEIKDINKEREHKIGEILKQQTFDWESMLKPETPEEKAISDAKIKAEDEAQKEVDYQKSDFDKKWAPTREVAISKLKQTITDAQNRIADWSSRVYKSSGGKKVEVGKDNDFDLKNVDVDRVNEKRRQQVIKGAQDAIIEAQKDLKRLGFSDTEINNLLTKKSANEKTEKNVEQSSLEDKSMDNRNPLQKNGKTSGETTKNQEGLLNDAVSKYGWSAVKNPEGFWLQNKDGKPIVKVVVNGKKGTYKFLDMSGAKLMDGRGQIEKSAEKLLKDRYYASEIKKTEPKIAETPPVKEASITEKKVEVPEDNTGVKYGDKTYKSEDQVLDDFEKFPSLTEYNKVLDDVRKFEEGLRKSAQGNSQNIDKKMGKSTKDAEDEMLKTFGKKKGDDGKLSIRFLPPDIISLGNTVLYKQLVKVRDAVANRIAGVLQKGMKNQMDLLRWPSKAITNFWGGLGRTQADIHGKGGKPGKLAFTGTVKSFAPYEAKELRGKWLDIVHSDPESLRRVLDVLDPDPEFAIEKLNVGDLSVAEKNLYFKMRDWNTWVHETNYANGFLDTETYLKNKDVIGDSKYIARMYDKYEGETLLDPAIQEFINRGNSAITTKMMTDMFKAREETTEWKKEHAIRDPTYLTAKRVMQTIQNVAIKDYMDLVIQEHPDFVLKVKKGEAAPKGYTRLGSSYSWGPFRNKAVINHVVEDFTGFFYSNAVANDLYNAFKKVDRSNVNQFYKKLRTVYNPMVQLGNVTGNIFFASANGINPISFLGKGVQAWQLYHKSPDVYKALLKTGLIGDVAFTGEMKPLAVIKSKEGGKLSKADELATKAYVGADNLAKISAYLVFREQGMSHDASVRRAYDAFQNYSTVGKTWDFTSKIPLIGPTFAKFQADLQRILVNNITTTPLTLIGTLMLIKMGGILASTLSGETEEERKEREGRKGVAKIPLVNIPLSFKVGKSEVNVARYLSPLYNYNYADAGTQLSEVSKFLPIQLSKVNRPILGETSNLPAFADATWGWIGSVAFDRDYRGVSIQNPNASAYHNANITTDERILNVMTYIARSQVPFFKGAQDMYDGIRGNLDYYGRKRDWKQTILNNIVKIQEFDKPELKTYVERNLDYLINRYTALAQRMGDANSDFLKATKDAEGKGLSKEALARVYATEDKKRSGQLQKSMDEQVPVMQELERLTKVYAGWYPKDPSIQENFQNIESGKNQRFNVLNDVDLQKKYPSEYSILKKNDLLNKPVIPSYYQGVQLTEAERKNYSSIYWSEYIRTLNTMGLTTQEEMDEAKKSITNIIESTTHPTPDKTTTLQEMAADAASSARDIANESFRTKK